MNKILLIGATSAIAEHCARLWAARGDALFLVARNEERLATIAADLRVRGAAAVATYTLDLNAIEGHAAMLDAAEAALGGIDVVLIAHGTLSDQKACEQSVAATLAEISTNALSTISLLTLVANRFEAKRAGAIAVISSVAGDRGRASNYVYGSAKGLVTAFTSGLRQRLHKANVRVVTIKPGFVDTPMTAAFRKGPLWARPDSVAGKIVQAIDRRRHEVYVPAFWRLIMTVIKSIPTGLFNRLNL
ncbi:SDR family oxidoreductase [Pseudoduganella armeniaca]|uniref:Short-chain dehydrogenase n=1 Tax=Pseudoduganella armeniaca TaxID=2072590 RepID=A0A2R4CC13_9BURK|nr:SDR family oxidoreductase [Pseudoduganella armeniaca]AVR97167.1 short-chain dehydrogenase [Pseudoduganella armeniaca]